MPQIIKENKFIILISIIIFLIIGGFYFLIANSLSHDNGTAYAAGESWLSGYAYRKQHTITGSADGAQTNYQVALTVYAGAGTDSAGTVYLNNRCLSWPNDIRFTKADGVTALNYWIESYDAASAKVWVKIDSIPVSPGTATIYIYYAMSSDAGASNGDNTFILFDTFDGTTINASKWATGNSSYNAAIRNPGGYLYSDGASTGGSYWWGHNWVQSVNPVGVAGTNGLRVDVNMYANLGNYVETLAIFYLDNTRGVSFGNELDQGFYGHELHTYEGGSANILHGRDSVTTNNRYGSYGANTWEQVGLSWTTAGAVTAWYDNTSATPRTYSTTGNIYLRLDLSNRDSGTTYSAWDTVRVRNYTTNEPTHGAWAAEQQVTAVCGSSNGQSFVSAPSTNLCSVGTASAVSGSGPYTWTCSITGGITANCSAQSVGTSWYSTSWPYRKPIAINNASGGALTDFQVKLSIPYVSSMKSDFSDIRFTASNATTILPYWIEWYGASSSATVWVKIASLPAGYSTIFMYYGNSSATSAANGDNTFIFFDDFDGSAINTSKWTVVNSTGFSVSGGSLHGTNTNGRITSIATFNPGVVLDIKEYRTGTLAPNGHGIGGFWISDANGIGWLDHPGCLYYRNDAAWVCQGTQAPADSWTKFSIAVPNSSQTILNATNWSTGAAVWSVGTLSNAVANEPISLGPRPGEAGSYPNQAYSAYWDYVYVRKYASVDSTGSLSTEQGIGVCGSANGQSFITAPTENLCSAGTASAVSGTGPFTWTCTGSVGTPASCSATVAAYTSTVYSATGISCSVTNQTCSGTTMFRLSNYIGGHAEIPSQSNYSYKVCCSGTGISNLSSGTIALKLSTNVSGGTNGTDAHIETASLSDAAYTNNVYVSGPSTVTCGYSTAGASCSDLGANYVCLSSINGTSVTGPNGITNAHVAACDQSSNFSGGTTAYLCCKASNPISACSSVVASDKSLSLGNVDIQLCAGTDTSASYASDPCYSTCWKGTGQPDPSNATNWKCSVCHDNSNNPVSCTALSGTTYSWTIPGSFTFKSGSATSAKPIINFTTSSVSRQLTLQVTSGNGPVCSGSSTTKSLPTWKPISPF